ncbi:hypothetical protein BC940DRAFT_231652 [Gongronella butleri]|nr:hypothetical protein BC940DRAFT_231652 [Gongronella butleri]
MMGYEFAVHVNQYLEAQGVPTRTIAKIDSNPAKSKHLETATTKLFDQEIDFCNLRTELYDEDSRIPAQITFGTPEQDAFRRDTTINSLFYNINTQTVEDLTGLGLKDLAAGLIRTPLSPYETFKEDPLRVLRCIRFASRFGFAMVPELVQAASDASIQSALVSKISKERIGTEVFKMLSGPQPSLAIHYIHQLGLYATVFDTTVAPAPALDSPAPKDPWVAVRAVDTLHWLFSQSPDMGDKRLLYLSAALFPFSDVFTLVKNKHTSLVSLLLRDALKANNHDNHDVNALFRVIPLVQNAIQRHQPPHSPISRQELGMLVRDIGALWPSAITLALVHKILTSQQEWQGQNDPNDEIRAHIHNYTALHQQIIDYGFQHAHEWRPMFDGKQATQMLGLRPGPVVQELIRAMMLWQFDHPNGTADECATMLKAFWAERQQQ